MFQSFWLITIIFSLFCSPKSLNANSVGLFDPYFVLLFHPRMANFDFGMQRFLKENPQSNTSEWLGERKKIIQNYQINKQSIKAKQTTAMRNFYADILNLRQEGIFGEDLDKRMPKLHAKHFGKIDKGLTEFNKFYESDERCLAIYKSMFRELSDLIRTVQKERNLYFVSPVNKNQIQVGIKSFSHTFQFELSGVNNYWKIVDLLTNKESNFNVKESVIRLRDYLSEANEYQSLFYPNLSNELIIIGEENVTTIILEKLYQNYAKKMSHANIIGDLYNLWKNSNF